MEWTAIQFSTNALYQPVAINGHGFTGRGTIVRYNGTNFITAQANSDNNAGVIAMVSRVENVNLFYVTQAGFVDGITVSPTEGGAFIPGTLYYLSQTAGQLTSTKPSVPGQIALPCYRAFTATSGFFFGNDGYPIPSGVVPGLTFVDNDISMVPNTAYLVDALIPISMTLPLVSEANDIIKIYTTYTSFETLIVDQRDDQYILAADDRSIVGTTGGLELYPSPAGRRGSLELVCIEADLGWRAIGSGNWYVI